MALRQQCVNILFIKGVPFFLTQPASLFLGFIRSSQLSIMNQLTVFTGNFFSHRISPEGFMNAFVHFVPELVGGGMLIPCEKRNPAV